MELVIASGAKQSHFFIFEIASVAFGSLAMTLKVRFLITVVR